MTDLTANADSNRLDRRDKATSRSRRSKSLPKLLQKALQTNKPGIKQFISYLEPVTNAPVSESKVEKVNGYLHTAPLISHDDVQPLQRSLETVSPRSTPQLPSLTLELPSQATALPSLSLQPASPSPVSSVNEQSRHAVTDDVVSRNGGVSGSGSGGSNGFDGNGDSPGEEEAPMGKVYFENLEVESITDNYDAASMNSYMLQPGPIMVPGPSPAVRSEAGGLRRRHSSWREKRKRRRQERKRSRQSSFDNEEEGDDEEEEEASARDADETPSDSAISTATNPTSESVVDVPVQKSTHFLNDHNLSLSESFSGSSLPNGSFLPPIGRQHPSFRAVASAVNVTAGLQAISMREARQTRDGFLMGKDGSTHWVSLLGPKELERHFPNRKARIFAGTFNMAGQKITTDSLEDWLLPHTVDTVPDIYAIGIQEGPLMLRSWTDWEVSLQSLIGPSHVLFDSVWMGVQHLSLFVRRELVWFLSIPEHDIYSTRAFSSVKTKGAIAIAFSLFGTSILMVSSHLAAHEAKANLRCDNYLKIVENIKFHHHRSKNPSDVTDAFDFVFWMGDLNFRLMSDREGVVETVEYIKTVGTATQRGDEYDAVLESDELKTMMREGLIFKRFSEGEIRFDPTYKYDIGTVAFNEVGKPRVPSYTDRILYKSNRGNDVTVEIYASVPRVCLSDHKPVFGVFQMPLRPGRDKTMPSGGRFKRSVYMQGLSPKPMSNRKKKQRSPARSTMSNLQSMDPNSVTAHRLMSRSENNLVEVGYNNSSSTLASTISRAAAAEAHGSNPQIKTPSSVQKLPPLQPQQSPPDVPGMVPHQHTGQIGIAPAASKPHGHHRPSSPRRKSKSNSSSTRICSLM